MQHKDQFQKQIIKFQTPPFTPVRKMSIAEQLSILNTDEALEITPESCRLRKAILDPHERKRSEKSGAAA